MKYALLGFAFALSACGAEAPPTHSGQGANLSGEVTLGVSKTL